MILPVIAVCLAAYLLGAIPFGVVISRLWGGIDIREYGSGNIGATNMFRVLGPIPGLIVMITDILKGWVPVWLAFQVGHRYGISSMVFPVAAGLCAIIGHNWSLFLKFRGGKGANTSLGVVIALEWRAALCCFVFWIIIVAATRYVSLASMLASALFPVAIWLLGGSPVLIGFGILVTLFSVYRHRSNIKRLLSGTESKFGQKVEVSGKK